MEYIEMLQNLGLNDKEARCYLALLPLNRATAYMVALRSGLKKPTAYVVLESLVNKGFAIKIPHQDITKYVAKSPKDCVAMIRERLNSTRDILPELMAMQNSIEDKPKVSFFEGKEGINLVDNDMLKATSEILAFTTPRFVKTEEARAGKEYIKKRVKSGIRVRAIGEVSSELEALKQKDKKELRQTRMLPVESYSSEVEIGIYDNKVFVSNYKKEFGLIIEDKDISSTLRKIFEIVWDSQKIIK
jgi:sugar-specific transcriptional regulator TrmB